MSYSRWLGKQRSVGQPGVIATFICFFLFSLFFLCPGPLGLDGNSKYFKSSTWSHSKHAEVFGHTCQGLRGWRALCESGFFLRCCVAKAAPTGPPPQRQVQRPSLVFLRCKRYNREGNREADRSQVEPACQRWIEMECWRDYFMIVIRFGNTANCKMTAEYD